MMRWLIMVLVPVALVGLGVRVLMTSAYLEFEYRRPGFPADQYGFSTEERILWGSRGIEYLLREVPPRYLADLRFANGQPLFTPRELSHMQDVKLVVGQVLLSWRIALALLVGVLCWAWRIGAWSEFRRGLRYGGLLTLAIAASAGILGTLGASGSGDLFWQFFSGFHGIFFSGDSWLFAYSDTLIRLYPLRFWQDSVLYIGVLAAVLAAALAWGLRDDGVASASGVR